MAIVKEVDIRVDADQAIGAMDKFADSAENVVEELEPLSTKIGEIEDKLYDLALAGETETKQFKDLTEEVGKYKKVIIDTDMSVDAFSTTTGQKLGGALQGVTGAFALGQGAMAAFGVEGEAVEAALLKVQAAMAINDGIQSIREAIPSFKALGAVIAKTAIGQKALNIAQAIGAVGMRILNAVMNANPVLLIITGITALVGAIILFSTETKKAAAQQDLLNASFEKADAIISKTEERLNSNARRRMKLLEAQGASESELHKERIKNIGTQNEFQKVQLDLEKGKIVELRKQINLARREGNDELVEENKTELASTKAKYDTLILQHKEHQDAKHIEDLDYTKKVEAENAAQIASDRAAYASRLSAQKAFNDNRIAAARRIVDLEISLLEEGFAKEKTARDEKLNRDLEDIKRDDKLKAEERADIERLTRENARLANIAATELELQEITLKTVDLKQQENEILLGIDKEGIDARTAQRDAAREQELLNEQKINDFKESAVRDGFNVIASLATAFAGDNEKAQKRAFKINKAASIANATIDTFKSANAAFASLAGIPIVGPVLGAAAAALAVGAGIANVKSISAQEFGGGSAGSPAVVSAGSLSGGGSSPANFNVVGNTGNNQLAQSLGNAPLKAYVVSGDMTTAQSLDRNKIESATL